MQIMSKRNFRYETEGVLRELPVKTHPQLNTYPQHVTCAHPTKMTRASTYYHISLINAHTI